MEAIQESEKIIYQPDYKCIIFINRMYTNVNYL